MAIQRAGGATSYDATRKLATATTQGSEYKVTFFARMTVKSTSSACVVKDLQAAVENPT
jgi:hypothetical protein